MEGEIRLRMVSMARSEYCCSLPCLPLFAGIHDLMADGDIQRVKLPLLMSSLVILRPILDLVLRLSILDCDFSCGILSSSTPLMDGTYSNKCLCTNAETSGVVITR